MLCCYVVKINLQLTYNHEGSPNNISDETRLSCQASHKLSHSTLISNHIYCRSCITIFSFYVFSNVCEQNINGISEDDEDDDEEEDDDDDDLFVNPNHQRTTYYVESDSSDTSDNGSWYLWSVLEMLFSISWERLVWCEQFVKQNC